MHGLFVGSRLASPWNEREVLVTRALLQVYIYIYIYINTDEAVFVGVSLDPSCYVFSVYIYIGCRSLLGNRHFFSMSIRLGLQVHRELVN
jgi:hypothetical protein